MPAPALRLAKIRTFAPNVTSPDMMLSNSKWSRSHVHLFGASPSTTILFQRRNNAPLTRVAIRAGHRRTPLCGGRLVCRAVAPLRVVKMRRCSFTPRFASKTIRSLAHFHDAGDEGDALVMIRRHCRRLQVAAIRGPRRMYIRKGKRSSRAIDERRSLRRREGEHVL